MTRRRRLALALLAATLVLLALLPGHPLVRTPLVERLAVALADAGVTLEYAASSGNLWRGLTLERVGLRADGVDVRLERLELRWFLPPLVTGELPLRLRLDALEGDVDVERALAVLVRDAPGGDVGLPAPRLLWQDVRVVGAALRFAGAPFTLPDVGIEDLSVRGGGDDVGFAATLRTAEGRVPVVGSVDPHSGALALEVLDADVRVARHWWDGIEGGRLHGSLRLEDGQLRVEANVERGALTAFGGSVDGIRGPLWFDGREVRGELTGRALGGSIDADVLVDIPAQRWQAEGLADVDVGELTPLLWALGSDGPAPPVSGRAEAELRAGGWAEVTLAIDALVDADAYGAEARALRTEVRYDPQRLSVSGSGALSGGTLELDLSSAGGVVDLRASVRDALWGPLRLDAIDAALRLGADQAGRADFVGLLDVAGGVPLRGDLSLDGDAAVLFVESDEVQGMRVQGAVAAPSLSADAPLEGRLRVELPSDWWAGPEPTTELVLGGTIGLPSGRVEVAGDAPARPAAGPWAVDTDLRGGVDLRLDDGTLALAGRLGPLAIGGGLDPDQGLQVALDALTWRGPATLTTPSLALTIAAPQGLWRVDERDGRLALTLPEGGWALALAALPVGVAGVDLALSGEATGSGSALAARLDLDGLDLSIDARVDDGVLDASLRGGAETLTLRGDASGWRASGALDVATLAPLVATTPPPRGRLEGDLLLRGDGSADGALALTLEAPLVAEARVLGDASGLRVDADTALAGETLRVAGRLTPELALEASLAELGPVRFDGRAGGGSGATDTIDLGPASVAAQAWTLAFDLGDARADLRWGANTAALGWRDELTIEARIAQPLTLASGAAVDLVGEARWDARDPDGAVDLELRDGAPAPLLTLRGDLREARLGGVADAERWSALLGDTVAARGELSWDGRARLLDGTGEAALSWRLEDGTSLQADAALGPDGLRWSASGAGLTASGDASAALASFDEVAPGAFLERPDLDLRLSGTLGYDGGWRGELTAETAVPLPARAVLRGDGPALTLAGSALALGDAVALELAGRWDGELAASVTAAATATAPAPLAEATASLDLLLDAQGLRGDGAATLPAGELGPAAWPGLVADLTLRDSSLALTAPGGGLSVDADGVRGLWTHPLLLAGVEHALVLDPAGDAVLTLTGPTLSARARIDDDTWTITLDADDPSDLLAALAPDLPAELLTLRAVTATLAPAPDPDAGLQAALAARWRPRPDLELPLELAATGDAAQLRGSAALGRVGTPRAQLTFALEDGAVSLDADVDDLGPPLALSLRADAQGWRVEAGERDGPWALTATSADSAGELATLTLRGPDTALRGSLSDALTLALAGELVGRDAALALTGDADDLRAELRWGEDHATLRYRPDATELALRLADLQLDLAGPSAPLRLDGSLGWHDERLPLTLLAPDADDQRWRARVDRTLTLALEGTGVRLDGTLDTRLAGSRVALRGDLGWSQGAGFDGTARLDVHELPGEAALEADLHGAGPLGVQLRALMAGRPAGGASGSVAADPRDGWALDLALDLPLAGEGIDAWRLALSGSAGGSPGDPQLDAALALAGPVAAHGRLWLDRGALRADLVGQALSASARLDEAGGRAQLRLDDADVTAWLPWLASPRLSLAVDARSLDDGIEAIADGIRLRLPNGEVSGQGRLNGDGRVDLTLRSDLDLADLSLGPALAGRLSGPVTLSAALAGNGGDASVAGVLQLDAGRVEGLDGRFDGDVQVTGPAADPRVSLALRASEGASGTVRATVYPARDSAQVDADVGVAAVRLVLRGQLAPDTLRADGRLVVGATPPIEIRSTESGVRLGRAGDTDALLLELRRDPWRVDVGADLTALSPSSAGRLDAALRWDGGPWPQLDGAVAELALAGLALGDWRLASAPDQPSRWQLDGDAGALTLDLDTLRWRGAIERLAVPIGTDELVASLELDGLRDAASVSLRLDGAVADSAVSLELDGRVDLGADGAQLTVSGTALEGRLDGSISRDADEGWRGALQLRDATLQGQALRADIALAGRGTLPDLSADARLDDVLELRARLVDDQLSFAADLATPVGAVAVAGDVWPRLDLHLTHDAADHGAAVLAGDALRLQGSLADANAPVRTSGRLRVPLGPLDLELSGDADGALEAALASPTVVAGALRTRVAPAPLLDAASGVVERGLLWRGEGDVAGTVTTVLGDDGLAVEVDALNLSVQGGRLALDGDLLGLERAALTIVVELTELDTAVPWWPRALALDAPLEAELRLADGVASVRASQPWPLLLEVDLERGVGTLLGDLEWRDGEHTSALRADLRLSTSGIGGQLEVQGLRFGASARAPLQLDGVLRGAGAELDLDLQLRSARSAAGLRGRLPLGVLPLDTTATTPARPASLDLRVAALDLRDLPGIDTVAPFLEGVVTGSVVLRGDRLAGQLLASDARLAERPVPLVATISGDLSGPSLEARVETTTTATGGRSLAASSVALAWDGSRFDALARLERFPVHALVEAVVGPTDVTTEVTGALRAGWSGDGSEPLDLRVATEHVRLERAGVVTVGRVAFELAGEVLRIQEAGFEGRGAWSASGEVRPERIDLDLVAEDADFGPLLGLVPVLARYAVGAEGDLRLAGRGTLAQPQLTLTSERLRVDVAGTSYELQGTDVRLQGEQLSLDADVAALAPLEGTVRLLGEGRVRLAPFDLGDLTLILSGDLDVPLVGRIADVDGTLERRSDASTALRVDASLGAPFTIEGSLTPLDLRVHGRGLQLAVPLLFVGDSVLDADLRVRQDDALLLSGRIDASSVRVDLGARAAVVGAAITAPAPTAAELAARRAALELVRFDDLRLVAPQRVTLSDTLGSGEAAFDLTLGGSAAEPHLSGGATALRGTLRFSGRDFELVRAEASFEPTRGVLPRLAIEARSQFEKARVLVPGSNVTFAAPPGPRFEVRLAFDADVITRADGELTLDLVPRLSSDASIEVGVGPDGLTAGARALTDVELLGLIALGRLEPGGGGAFAGAVAQTALDTAVDLLVVSELQAALSEALGIDLVEIRTTALTDLIGGADDPFSVSLRFGGYLSDELFASYRVGTFDDAERAFAFTNELLLTYDLGPVAIDIATTLDFPVAGMGQPVPGLAAALRYDISRAFAVEAGVELGTERQTARLGVTLRW